jgi:hypothetical protein
MQAAGNERNGQGFETKIAGIFCGNVFLIICINCFFLLIFKGVGEDGAERDDNGGQHF